MLKHSKVLKFKRGAFFYSCCNESIFVLFSISQLEDFFPVLKKKRPKTVWITISDYKNPESIELTKNIKSIKFLLPEYNISIRLCNGATLFLNNLLNTWNTPRLWYKLEYIPR